MTKYGLRKGLIAGLHALILGAAGWSTYVELGQYSGGPRNNILRAERLTAGLVSPGLSLSATKYALDECIWALKSLFGSLLPEERRRLVESRCDAIGATATVAFPTFAYAWLVMGYLAEAQGDAEGLSAAVSRSQALEPSSQWVAELRALLAEDHFAELSSEAAEALEQDLALLVRSRLGVSVIATRYVEREDFRARITDIVDRLPEADQRRFVVNVKRAIDRLEE